MERKPKSVSINWEKREGRPRTSEIKGPARKKGVTERTVKGALANSEKNPRNLRRGEEKVQKGVVQKACRVTARKQLVPSLELKKGSKKKVEEPVKSGRQRDFLAKDVTIEGIKKKLGAATA